MTTYEPVIGMEVHAEMLTRSKMFCACPVVDSVTAPPNTVVCPVCAGLPGTLPVINQRAVEFALRVALALNCHIPPVNVFARKNYFYPDLPKGYQVSQYELPLGVNGWLDLTLPDRTKRVRIRRVHLEEDTGKLNHPDRGDYSLVDLNRAGVPLLEIVTEPDFADVAEVRAYGEALRSLLRYLGVNNGDMEKGVIRFEANISVRPAGTTELRTRTEVKNLNSFRAVERASLYEIQRQTGVWESGGRVMQQTMGWDGEKTVPQRGKEHAHDYRYFPEPDLPPLALDMAWVESIRADLPELPAAKRARFMADFGLTAYEAHVLVEDQATAAYFEQAVRARPATVTPKTLANWMLGELFRLMNDQAQTIEQVRVSPAQLGALAGLVAEATLNLNTAKTVLGEMFATGHDPAAIVAARGLAQVSDTSAIERHVAEVIAANPQQLQTYLAGKDTLEQWFFGQVMKALKGQGNPQVIRQVLQAQLAHLKQTRAS